MIHLTLALLLFASPIWAQGFPSPGPGHAQYTGGGGDVTPPAVPTGLAAVPANSQVTLTWSHSNPGDVDEYVVQYRCPSGSGGYTESTPRPTTTLKVVSGLTNGVQCDFRVAAEDTANNQSAFTTAIQSTPSAGGGANFPDANGFEQRYTDLAGTGLIALCGEPLNKSEANSGSITFGNDFASSDNGKECWGRGSPYQAFNTDGSTVTVEAASGFGSATHALRQDGYFLWLNGYRTSFLASGAKTQCHRYYLKTITPFGNAGGDLSVAKGDCPAGTTWRHKMMAGLLTASGQTQLEEAPASNAICDATGATRGDIDLGLDLVANVKLQPTINLNACDSAACRVEWCMDGDFTTGQDMVDRARIVDENGVTHSVTITNEDFPGGAAGSHDDFWGGDIFHSGPGYVLINFYLHAVKGSADSNFWLGCSPEVEGDVRCPVAGGN